MALTGVFHFMVNRLWIDAGLRGRNFEIVDGDVICRIVLPSTADSFAMETDDDAGSAITGYVSGPDRDPISDPTAVEVTIVRIEVISPGDLTRGDFSREDLAAFTTASEEGFRILKQLQFTASRALESVLTWARVLGPQPWLLLSGDRLKVFSSAVLLDGAGDRLPVGVEGPSVHMHLGIHDYAIDDGTASDIVERINGGESPPLAAVLIDDATFIVQEASWRNLRHAVLLAAIASEVAVKTALERGASLGQASLVGLLLDNPRDFSLAAASLFDKACGAVFGRSLRDEDRGLFKRVERLFQDRNKIAHRTSAAELSDDQLRDDVRASREAIGWTTSLLSTSDASDEATPLA